MPKGWARESQRHSLASRGITTPEFGTSLTAELEKRMTSYLKRQFVKFNDESKERLLIKIIERIEGDKRIIESIEYFKKEKPKELPIYLSYRLRDLSENPYYYN